MYAKEEFCIQVPSNTKANLFVAFAEGTGPFKKVVEDAPKPNAVTMLKELKPDEGCQISYAADMCAVSLFSWRSPFDVGAERACANTP